MKSQVYYQLRDRLNQDSPLGFATTENGIEIKVLEYLFTEEEAEMFLHLTPDLQTAIDVAKKINRDTEEVEQILQRMTKKGCTYSRPPKKDGERWYFAAAPFTHGIFDQQVNRMDKEMGELFGEHLQAGFITQDPAQDLRIVPVETAVENSVEVLPYENVRKIIQSKERIALGNCFCTTFRKFSTGEICDKPLETCMMFDFYADHYVGQGWMHKITQEEALAKTEEFEKAGLVPQISNSENAEFLCHCCPDCCLQLIWVKESPKPGLIVPSNYFSEVDSELCTACQSCIERCPMKAIAMNQAEIAKVNRERCIGCGLCINSCPEEALKLLRKPPELISTPPERSPLLRSTKELEMSIKKTSVDS